MRPNEDQLVSVIIPFLNPGKWLNEAVDSVLIQNYSNWEIILVDDGSVENDSNIAKEYALNYPEKIIYLDHPGHINKGLTATRNYGISFSKGTLIAFLDADDCWLPERLSKQIELFLQFPEASMICEASCFWYSWKDSSARDIHINIGANRGLYQPSTLNKFLYPLGIGQPPCPSGIIIKRDAFDRIGGFEESFSGIYQLYEDQAFLAKIYLSEFVYISDTANNLYRKREDSMSGAANDKKLYNKVRSFFFRWLQKYLQANQVKDQELIQLLNGKIANTIIDLE